MLLIIYKCFFLKKKRKNNINIQNQSKQSKAKKKKENKVAPTDWGWFLLKFVQKKKFLRKETKRRNTKEKSEST